MGFGRTSSDNHPINAFAFNCLLDFLLRIPCTREHLVRSIDYIRKGLGESNQFLDVDHTGDIATTVADENPNPGIFNLKQVF